MEFWFSEFHTPDVKHSIRVNRQLYSKQSDYQRIDIFETPEFGRVLTLDGNVMLTERDEFIYDEMIVHVPMAVHKEAKDILVIGAGDGGVVRELTRYDRVERIDLVEMDPQVVEACRAYLPGNACRMDDRRVHIYFENALKYIRRCEEEYDLIIRIRAVRLGNGHRFGDTVGIQNCLEGKRGVIQLIDLAVRNRVLRGKYRRRNRAVLVITFLNIFGGQILHCFQRLIGTLRSERLSDFQRFQFELLAFSCDFLVDGLDIAEQFGAGICVIVVSREECEVGVTVDDIVAGAELLITACPLCLYNLNRADGHGTEVHYFTELLAEALGVKE